MVTTLLFWLKSGFAWAGFYLLRLAESVFPHSVLSLLLWVPAAAWGLTELGRRKLGTSWRRFPEAWRPGPARFFLRQSLGLYHARLVYTWPDRLRTPRWLSRCRLEGVRDLTELWGEDKGVILASLHLGPFETLPYWLRAHGIVATTLLGRPARQKRLKRRLYGLSAPADVPVFLPVNQMPRIRRFLGSGRRLLVMVDVNRGKQIRVPFDDYLFRMATGAIRLAALSGAALIPCLIVETGLWHFTLHFGTPVPGRYLGGSPNLTAAAAHLLAEFLKVIPHYPSQCGHRLLSAISPAPVEGD